MIVTSAIEPALNRTLGGPSLEMGAVSISAFYVSSNIKNFAEISVVRTLSRIPHNFFPDSLPSSVYAQSRSALRRVFTPKYDAPPLRRY